MSEHKYAEGDIVRVARNISRHGFKLGERCRITELIHDVPDVIRYKAEHLDGHDYWWVDEDEIGEIANLGRAERADQALRLYAEIEGSEAYEDDAESLLCDLLTDLRHWADENDIDFYGRLNLSYAHYVAERKGEP